MKTTLQQVIEAHRLVSATVTTIFQNEEDFKWFALAGNGWDSEEYTIERCHAALRYRLTLKHYDGREKDVYIESDAVYSWMKGLGVLGEQL
jgi:hypothetical protein